MSAIPHVIAGLQANTPVVALAGARIHAVAAPQAEFFPSIVVLQTSEAEEYSIFEGATSYPESRVTVMCRAQTAGDAIRLGDAVIAALKNVRSGGVTIWRDQVDSTDFVEDAKIFRRLLGFHVRYRI